MTKKKKKTLVQNKKVELRLPYGRESDSALLEVFATSWCFSQIGVSDDCSYALVT